jgi:hypothetical protein
MIMTFTYLSVPRCTVVIQDLHEVLQQLQLYQEAGTSLRDSQYSTGKEQDFCP